MWGNVRVMMEQAKALDEHAPIRELLKLVREGDWMKLQSASLSSRNFSGEDLEGAVLREIDFHDSYFMGANLRCVDFSGANLSECFFNDAILDGACLANTSLRSAYLRNARLCGADLTGACLDQADLQGTIYNSQTKWPQGYDVESSGACFEVP